MEVCYISIVLSILIEIMSEVRSIIMIAMMPKKGDRDLHFSIAALLFAITIPHYQLQMMSV